MVISHLSFQFLLFLFPAFTLVLSRPIPTDIVLTTGKRTTYAKREAYDALKKLDEDITAILPQIGRYYFIYS